MAFQEYNPPKYNSWMAYYNRTTMADRIKSWLGSIAGTFILLGAYAFNGLIENLL